MEKILEIHQKIAALFMSAIVFLAQLFNPAKFLLGNNIIPHQPCISNQVVSLPCCILLQIPCYQDYRMQKSINLIEQTISCLTHIFFGTTYWNSLGTYKDQAGLIVDDMSVWINCYSTVENFENNLAMVINWVHQVGIELEQESMLVIVNGVAHLIFMQHENNEINH